MRGTRPLEIVNRVYIDRPKVLKEENFHKLDDYLPILQTYDPQKLDAVALRQLVLAYQFKIDSILAPSEPAEGEEAASDEQPQEGPESERASEKVAREREAKRAEALQYVTAAVTAGQAPFLAERSAAQGDEDLIKLARLVSPMARDEMGGSRTTA